MTRRYAIEPMPLSIPRGPGRPEELTTAVVQGRKVVAVFKSENEAWAYMHRKNKLSEQGANV